MLLLEHVDKSYIIPGRQHVPVLHIPYFQMSPQEKVALVGPSGSGKSTLLHMIAGILRPTSGTIRLLDKQLDSLRESELDRFRAKHIGYVFQSFNLLPGFTAMENVLAAMRFGQVIPPKLHKERAADMLDQVGLSHRLHHKSGQLSNGEQQRVSIARALVNNPALVLADEPTASLDYANAEQVAALLNEACRSHGAALLLCSHDLELAGTMDRIINIRELSQTAAGRAG
ncbi:ABC transporter ATP-binding protein [Paenibacillus sp. FSL H7-0331]|uniref:ABC transporter ATP-binding protein n=1 Tax=Paenibacillus sp. FSL H7-0331 TaxID=1920421 RepID=UPI00096EC40B|nr:ABC transporter ATP-binding protein [Paenibacillus sp. FSL H7-0331]OMF19971.1 ABC transporter ATP-binding protein [Paenibacillus sp. FSL H7-0331]